MIRNRERLLAAAIIAVVVTGGCRRAPWMNSFPKVLQQGATPRRTVGKYHMGEGNDEPRPGFEYFVTLKGQGKYFGTEFNLNGERREVKNGYYTTAVTDIALDWLQRDRLGRPWMMILGHKAPHSFYTPEDKYTHAFRRG